MKSEKCYLFASFATPELIKGVKISCFPTPCVGGKQIKERALLNQKMTGLEYSVVHTNKMKGLSRAPHITYLGCMI